MADDTENKNNPPAAAAPETGAATGTNQSDEIALLKAQLAAMQAQLVGLTNPMLAQAQARDEALANPLTETIQGGLYLAQDKKTYLNAYGRRVDKSGKPLSRDDEHLERIR
jgi:hypothetical protein